MADTHNLSYKEKEITPVNGWLMLFISIAAYFAAFFLIVGGSSIQAGSHSGALGVLMIIAGALYMAFGWILWLGLKTVRPNEALVLTLFGKYYGTIKKEGFYRVNPFCAAINPARRNQTAVVTTDGAATDITATAAETSSRPTISLKAQVFDNNKQKINDAQGNPIEVGIVVTWQVIDTAKAVFNVDNYVQFVQIQADSALRDVVRRYPYDEFEQQQVSLRGDSEEVSEMIEKELQDRVELAGIRILDARITHLAYAPEIAAAMLQRQQAEAIIEARQKIVDGAVGMVEMALKKLSENDVCMLDDERKAQMVSNLLVVLCGNKDAQPVVNSGSIY
ncbi:MAG: SPFH domain-containing protein [Oscillospiraceae bacterium]|nr:SPFH domain-containing protein [Oscillospiraceae bacterium]